MWIELIGKASRTKPLWKLMKWDNEYVRGRRSMLVGKESLCGSHLKKTTGRFD